MLLVVVEDRLVSISILILTHRHQKKFKRTHLLVLERVNLLPEIPITWPSKE